MSVDEATLRALLDDMGGDAEVVKELVQSYLEEAPRLLAEARVALAAGDAAALQRAVHTLKSTSATFGALQLAEASRAVEQGVRAGEMPAAAALAALETQFQAARAALLERLG
ncbi:MAG TPA: Hpt domain-containing protein [Candidatus Thermoplasmatota archaeon]|nr:Hpt domain-containing protein [Candidatus Thermoplasmatota archaeon]